MAALTAARFGVETAKTRGYRRPWPGDRISRYTLVMDGYNGDAELIAEDRGAPIKVTVRLRSRKRGVLSTWSGYVLREGDEVLRIESGSQHTIRLPSGGEGTILVHHMAMNWHVRGEVRQRLDVVGSGPAPF